MEETPKKRPAIEQRTTQLVLFKAALGWTAFILTAALWTSSSKRHAKSIESHHVEMHKKDEVVTRRDQTISDKDSILKSKDIELSKRNSSIIDLDSQLSDVKMALAIEKSDAIKRLESERLKRVALFGQIQQSPKTQGNNEAILNYWASVIKKAPVSDAPFNEEFHSYLAEQYFTLSLIEKTREHLTLSNHFNPEQEKRINDSLSLSTAITIVEKSIQNRLPADQIATALKHAYALVDELSKDPTKKELAEQLRSKLLKLETVSALNAPPKEALVALHSLMVSQQTAAQKATSPLSQRLHFLETATMAYGLSRSLNRDEDATLYKKQIDVAAELVAKLKKDHPQISQAKAAVKLRELDALFIDGESSIILKNVSLLQTYAKQADSIHSVIYLAAADGHKAAVFYERGEITNGRNLITAAIDKLKAVCDKVQDHSLAHFRLGILHWLQAQLTQSADVTYLQLNLSSKALNKASKTADRLQERAIRQFAAMVEGDLGHLNAEKGKKDTAKKHFTTALSHWNAIVGIWGENEETKEGIRYCKWRVSKL